MSILRFHLFNNHCVVDKGSDQKPIQLFPAARNLLAYLLVQRHKSHSREVLAEIFWKHDGQRARQCLRTTLWRLRNELEGVEGRDRYLLVSSDGDIAFNNASDHWLDVAVFEEGVTQGLITTNQGMTKERAEVLEAACNCYKADLLESLYDDWAIRERERLRLLYLRAMSILLHYYRQSDAYEQGVLCGQRILDIDCFRESVHRELMHLHASRGHRTLALRQYEKCRAILVNELGVKPMPETEAVYWQIKAETMAPGSSFQSLEQPGSRQRLLQQMMTAIETLEQTQTQLKRVMQKLQRMIECWADETSS
jgi:DNA-binding SARP family transcriptional activator